MGALWMTHNVPPVPKSKHSFESTVDEILQDIKALLIKKHQDYGDQNLERFGLFGITVRMADKIARLENLQMKEVVGLVEDETIEDTIVDLAGYAIQALRMIEERKRMENDT